MIHLGHFARFHFSYPASDKVKRVNLGDKSLDRSRIRIPRLVCSSRSSTIKAIFNMDRRKMAKITKNLDMIPVKRRKNGQNRRFLRAQNRPGKEASLVLTLTRGFDCRLICRTCIVRFHNLFLKIRTKCRFCFAPSPLPISVFFNRESLVCGSSPLVDIRRQEVHEKTVPLEKLLRFLVFLEDTREREENTVARRENIRSETSISVTSLDFQTGPPLPGVKASVLPHFLSPANGQPYT